MAYETNPTAPNSSPREWKPKKDPSSVNWRFPTTCVTFNNEDNYCQISKLEPINANLPTSTGLDPIQDTLNDYLNNLEALRQSACINIGNVNFQLLSQWLFNTDPELKQIEAALNSGNGTAQTETEKKHLYALKTLASGLGLIPREILLKKRIDRLQKYVNFPKQTVDINSISKLQNQNDWAASERTQQAFFSAYHTLGSSAFPAAEITLTELLPGDEKAAKLLALKDIQAGFDAFAIRFALKDPSGTTDPCQQQSPTTANGTTRDCVQCLTPISLKPSNLKVNLGVYKDADIYTYYALQLKANAKILFNPWGGDVELKAYSAAQPFGSRIGPPLQESDFTMQTPKGSVLGLNEPFSGCAAMGSNFCYERIPNLPVYENDGAPSPQNGWYRQDVQYYFYKGFSRDNSGNVPSNISYEDITRAYQVSMVPNPWEINKYNILNNFTDDFMPAFSSVQGNETSPLYHSIWAPLFTQEEMSEAGNMTSMIEKMLNSLGTASADSPKLSASFITGIKKGFTEYFSKLEQGGGEDMEGRNVVRLRNPFSTHIGDDIIKGPPDQIFVKDASKVRSSWNDVKSPNFVDQGRNGYSVKIVPLQLLNKPSDVSPNNGNARIKNPPVSSDNEMQEDFDLIQH
jgi:hypothetical protein